MIVLHLCTNDITGGAARAAYRLHTGLRGIGINSNMLVQHKASDDNTIIAPKTKLTKALALLRPYLDQTKLFPYTKKEKVIFSPSVIPDNLQKNIQRIKPDIVCLHWVNKGFMRVETIGKITVPIVWVMHDMWPFTGGCHYNFNDCENYKNKCGKCPILHSSSAQDLSRKMIYRKMKSYEKAADLTLVAPSIWLANCASESSLLRNLKIVNIPNGIATEVYKPISKEIARNLLNLPIEKKLVLFGALDALSDKRKGYHLLMKALNEMRSWDAEIAIFGSSGMAEKIDLDFKIEVNYLGKLHEDVSLAILYSAADVTIVPSLQENLSNVIMESLSCGTPVVAYEIGGNKDMIKHKYNGFLAIPYDAESLAEGIDWILAHPDPQSLGKAARKAVLDQYDIQLIAERNLQLYNEILGTNIESRKFI